MTEKEIGCVENMSGQLSGGKKHAGNQQKMCKIFCYTDTQIVKYTLLLNAYFSTNISPKYGLFTAQISETQL
jgi:hypothetical protein